MARESISLEDPGLLRASRVAVVLRGCGSLLRDSKGSAETFEQSRPVGQIDAFISHNWSTSPRQKWMVLAIYFNFSLAVSVALVLMVVCFGLTIFGVLPCVEFEHEGMVMGNSGVSSLFVGSAAMLLTLFFGRGVAARFGLSGPMVFLDKTCIHQTDPELKMRGIKSLPAQLIHSSSVVAVYTETYLQKVWTVYELASVLTLHPDVTLVVLPLFVTKLVILGALVYPIRFAAVLFLKTDATGSWGNDLSRYGFDTVLFPVYLLFAMVLRGWAKERLRIQHTVSHFDLRSATCALESDRALVKDNIVSFVRAFEYVTEVTEASSDEEALAAFNALVHKKVPRALTESFGCTGMPHLFLLATLVGSVGRCLDSISSLLRHHADTSEILRMSFCVTTLYASWLPNNLALMSGVLSRRTELGAVSEVLLVTLSALGTVFFNLAGKEALLTVSHQAAKLNTLLAWQTYAFALFIIVSFGMTYGLFFYPRGLKPIVFNCSRRCCGRPRRKVNLQAMSQADTAPNTSASDEEEHGEDDESDSLADSGDSISMTSES